MHLIVYVRPLFVDVVVLPHANDVGLNTMLFALNTMPFAFAALACLWRRVSMIAARFEVNWEGPDALANLTPATQAAAATAARASAAAPSAPAPRGGVDEQEGEERRREGSPNEDQRQ